MSDYSNLLHKIPRDEWVKRFKARIAEVFEFPEEELDDIANAEIDSYPLTDEYPVAGMPNDWEITTPEEAADECLSNWTE